MSNAYIIQESTLNGIGDAIREKTGGTDLIPLLDMESEIRNIKTGSPNGTEWTRVRSGDTTLVKFVNDKLYIAVYGSGLYYKNGDSWTLVYGTDGYIMDVTFFKGVYIMSFKNNRTSYYSEDGISSWTACTTSDGTKVTHNRGVYTFDDKIVICPNTGAYWSEDGKTYQVIDKVTGYSVRGMVYFNDKYYIASGRNVYVSSTLESFATKFIGTDMYGLTCYNNMLILSTKDKGMMYSLDGGTWNNGQNTTYTDSSGTTKTATLSRFCHFKNVLIACGENSGLWYSEDGLTWFMSNVQFTNATNGVPESIAQPRHACGVCVIPNDSKYGGLLYTTNGKDFYESNLRGAMSYYVWHHYDTWYAATYNGLYSSVTWEPPV